LTNGGCLGRYLPTGDENVDGNLCIGGYSYYKGVPYRYSKLTCPSAEAPNGIGNNVYYRYAQDLHLCGRNGATITIDGKSYGRPCNIKEVNFPDQLMVLMDCGDDRETYSNSTVGYGGANYSYRHNQGANVLHADWHVEFWNKDALPTKEKNIIPIKNQIAVNIHGRQNIPAMVLAHNDRECSS